MEWKRKFIKPCKQQISNMKKYVLFAALILAVSCKKEAVSKINSVTSSEVVTVTQVRFDSSDVLRPPTDTGLQNQVAFEDRFKVAKDSVYLRQVTLYLRKTDGLQFVNATLYMDGYILKTVDAAVHNVISFTLTPAKLVDPAHKDGVGKHSLAVTITARGGIGDGYQATLRDAMFVDKDGLNATVVGLPQKGNIIIYKPQLELLLV